jgi:hypothetical protein
MLALPPAAQRSLFTTACGSRILMKRAIVTQNTKASSELNLYTKCTVYVHALHTSHPPPLSSTSAGSAATGRALCRALDGGEVRDPVEDVLLAGDLPVLADDVVADEDVAGLADVVALEDDDAVAVVAVRERRRSPRVVDLLLDAEPVAIQGVRVRGLGDGRRQDLRARGSGHTQRQRGRLKTHGGEQADGGDHEEERLAEDHGGKVCRGKVVWRSGRVRHSRERKGEGREMRESQTAESTLSHARLLYTPSGTLCG